MLEMSTNPCATLRTKFVALVACPPVCGSVGQSRRIRPAKALEQHRNGTEPLALSNTGGQATSATNAVPILLQESIIQHPLLSASPCLREFTPPGTPRRYQASNAQSLEFTRHWRHDSCSKCCAGVSHTTAALLTGLAGGIVQPAGGRGWIGFGVAVDLNLARRAAVLHPARLHAKTVHIQGRLLHLGRRQRS